MGTITATSFRKDLFNILDNTIKFNEPLNITTKNGEAVLLSKEDYEGLLATAEIMSDEALYSKVLEGMNEDLSLCVPEKEVSW